MKVLICLILQFYLVLYAPIRTVAQMTDEDIYQRMHIPMKHCGPKLADLMSELCVKHNGYRSKRSITKLTQECCLQSCSFTYIMKYYCDEPRIQIDNTDLIFSSTAPTAYTRVRTVQISTESVSQSSENSGQASGSLPNKIEKQYIEMEKKPADYGYVRSTRPPIIYGHSNTIERGLLNYQLSLNSSRQ